MRKYRPSKQRRDVPALGELSHRVTLCTASDVVASASEMRLTRHAALQLWAKIAERAGSLMDKDGQPVREERERRTHEITVRACPGVEISAMAWVFEPRSLLSPRWFKVLGVKEDGAVSNVGRFWCLSCRLVERSDAVSLPSSAPAPVVVPCAVPLPPGVKL